MSKQAILFGSIGVLVETSEIQRQSFNQAFKEAGLNWSWDRETYRTLLKSSGGEKRIREYANTKGKDVDAGALHKRKTEIFDDTMVQQGLSLRDGIAEVMKRAKQDGVKLAFVTTTSRANVDAIFEALGDSLQRGDFDFVGDTSVTAAAKPSPDIYVAALDALALDAAACIAIEDTGVSAQAPLAAGIQTVGFPGEYADPADFDACVTMVERLNYAELVGTD